MLTTAQSGIWIGLLVTSLWEPAKNIQDTFDRAWRAVKTFLDYLLFISYQNWKDFYVKEVYHLALQFGV